MKTNRIHGLAVLLLCCVSFSGFAADWKSCADLTAFKQAEHGMKITCRLTSGETVFLQIEVLGEKMLRVRASREEHFEPTLPERDGFLKANWPKVGFSLRKEKSYVVLDTGSLEARISRKPLRLAFYQDGKLLIGEPGKEGLAWSEDSVRLAMASPEGERFLGFGDQGAGAFRSFPPDRAPLDHRGQFLVMAGLSSERHYYLPFFMSSQGYGFFLNTLAESIWDMAKTDTDRYRVEIQEPQADYYLIAGPSFRDILMQYTELAGRPPLPPRWELGGRVSARTLGVESDGKVPEAGWNVRWLDQKQIEAAAREIREQHIPCDYFHLDSAWQTIRNSFDWVAEIPGPGEMIAQLNRLHFRVGLWQRPTLAEGEYRLYREAEERDYLVKGPDGYPFICRQKYGGPSAMVDFTNPEAVRWWQQEQEKLVAAGAVTFKLDSASSGFIESFPEAKNLRFHNGMTGKQLENYYGPLYLKTVWDGLKKSLRGKRAVLHVFHQTYFAGGRFPYMGLGDRTWRSTTAHLVRFAANYGLSGIPFWDGGGFGAFGLPGVDLELQIRLIPHTYTYWHIARETGLPVFRSLVLEYQDDPQSYLADTQFLYGKEFLVAPPLEDNQQWRRAYLPAGEWVNYWTKDKYIGPGWEYLPVGDKREAVLVRGGAIIPMGPMMEYAGEKPVDPLTLDIYPSGESDFTLYEDDGETYAYETGACATTRFACREEKMGVRVEIGPTQGNYDGKPPQRVYILQVNATTCPRRVIFNGQELPASAGSEALNSISSGWWYRMRNGYDRTLFVKLPPLQAGQGARINLEAAAPVRYYRH